MMRGEAVLGTSSGSSRIVRLYSGQDVFASATRSSTASSLPSRPTALPVVVSSLHRALRSVLLPGASRLRASVDEATPKGLASGTSDSRLSLISFRTIVDQARRRLSRRATSAKVGCRALHGLPSFTTLSLRLSRINSPPAFNHTRDAHSHSHLHHRRLASCPAPRFA